MKRKNENKEEQKLLFDVSAAEALGIISSTGKNGVECPQCGCTEREVRKTVPIKNGIRRYTTCAHCGRHGTTIERFGNT